MASEISNTYRRQVLHVGNIFNWKEQDVDSNLSPVENAAQHSSINRPSTRKRRVIHVEYEDVFGSMETLPKLNGFDTPLAVPPSPKYEQTVYGLSDESLEYFPQRRRGSRRVTANIVKNLTSEFDQLADDVQNHNIEKTDKRFLKVPNYCGHPGHKQHETKSPWDEVEISSKVAYDKSKDEPQQLRRKPIRRLNKPTGDGEEGGLACTIA